MKKALIIIMVLIMVFMLVGCTPSATKQAELLAEAGALLHADEYATTYTNEYEISGGNVILNGKSYPRDSLYSEALKNLRKLGFEECYYLSDSIDNKHLLLTEEGLNTYLETHTVEELFYVVERICSIYEEKNGDYHWFGSGADCTCVKLEQLVDMTIKVSGAEYLDLSEIIKTDVEPQVNVSEVSGNFFDENDVELYTETREKIETTYDYGDFTIRHLGGYKYDDGRYEWFMGEFYDEPASWLPINVYILEYKGRTLLQEEDLSFEEFLAKASEIQVAAFEESSIYILKEVTTDTNYDHPESHTFTVFDDHA